MHVLLHTHTLLGAPHTASASGEFISGLAIAKLDTVKPSQLQSAPESRPLTLHDSWEGTPEPMLHDAQSRKTDELELTPKTATMGNQPGDLNPSEPGMSLASLTDDLKRTCQEVLQSWEQLKPLMPNATPFDLLEKMCGDMTANNKGLCKKFLDEYDDTSAKLKGEEPSGERETETIAYEPDPPAGSEPEKKKMDKSYWALLACTHSRSTIYACIVLSKTEYI